MNLEITFCGCMDFKWVAQFGIVETRGRAISFDTYFCIEFVR